MKQEKRVPKRRFRAFATQEAAWKEDRLASLASMHARIGWQNLRTDEFLDSGDYYLITGTDFNDGSVDFSTCHYVAKERFDQDPNIQVHNDDILITKDGTLGKVAYIEGMDGPGTLNAGVFVIRSTTDDIDMKFLYQYLAAPFLMEYANNVATGGTIKHLNQNVLIDFPVKHPADVREQHEIGAFCCKLDHLITSHERKLQKLAHLKQAYLAEMFPVKGERQPRRRFKGFRGDWNTSTLGELVSIQSGEAPSKFQPGKMPYIKVDDLNDSTRLQTTSKECVARNELISMIPANSVIFPKRGVSILTNKVRILAQDSYMDTNMMALIPQQIDYEFLYVFISKTGLYKIADTSTIPQINNKHIIPYEIIFPGNEEQHRIGRFFRAADQRIESEQRKLSKLRALKQAYLSELFV